MTTSFLAREPRKPVLWVGGSLAHLGKNPHGTTPEDRNLWRVVWSQSREHMFKAPGAGNFIWIPSYLGYRCYVLEKWCTPYEYDKCTREIWDLRNRTMGDLGPYPSKGVYFGPFWTWDNYPSLGEVETIVSLIDAGRTRYSDAERTRAVIEDTKRQEQVDLQRAKEMILDSLPLDVTRGKLSNRFYNDAENIPENFSAEQVQHAKGLPLGDGKSFTSGSRGV